MSHIVVVDDVAVDRALLCGLLQGIPGADVRGVASGREALDLVARVPVDLLVTDVMMPEMNGLELAIQARRIRSTVPVIVTTALGDEAIGEQALRAGATDFVPKSRLSDWLVPMATHILAIAGGDRSNPRLIDRLSSAQFSFGLGNSLDLIPGAADLVRDMVAGLWRCDDTEKIRLGVILEHALTYAILYSNLELDDGDLDGCDPWSLRVCNHPLLAERLRSEPYRRRESHLSAAVTLDEARFTLKTDGRRLLPQQQQVAGSWCDIGAPLSRTLMMMTLLLDQISFDEQRNELVLIRRREADAPRIAA